MSGYKTHALMPLEFQPLEFRTMPDTSERFARLLGHPRETKFSETAITLLVCGSVQKKRGTP